MKVKSKVNVRIYSDTADQDSLYGPADSGAEESATAYNEQASNHFSIPASGSITLDFNSVATVNGFFIRAKGGYTVDINGLGALTVTLPTGHTYAKCYMNATTTSLVITNSSSTAALVGDWSVWGD